MNIQTHNIPQAIDDSGYLVSGGGQLEYSTFTRSTSTSRTCTKITGTGSGSGSGSGSDISSGSDVVCTI